jgi:hypothetical protein
MLANKSHPFADRGDDFYPTPIEAVRSLMAVEKLPQVIWEPACGDGAIVKPLRAAGHDVVATDLIDRGCPNSLGGINFLKPLPARPVVDGIVTNPPFRWAQSFITQGLEYAPYVVMLLRLQFLEGAKRREWLKTSGLARVHVSSRRLPMMHRDGWDGPKSTSAVAFAWFVFLRDHKGAPEIDFFDYKDLV